MQKTLLLSLSLFIITLTASADAYESLWKKAQKQQTAAQTTQVRTTVDKIYQRALREGNMLQLTRTLYAYDQLGITLTEDSIVKNAKRVWTARRQERNAVQHALLTHMLGRLTDNDYLLALSVADTAFLRQQRVREHLPLVKGYSLHEIFSDYLRQRDMPDSVFVGWERPVEEDTTTHKHYDFTTEKRDFIERNEGPTIPTIRIPKEGDLPVKPVPLTPAQPKPVQQGQKPAQQGQKPTQQGTLKPETAPQREVPTFKPVPTPSHTSAPALSGEYAAYVFNVPGGMSRTCLVEAKSGNPVRQWRLHRNDGRGMETDINADGNGHVWQRPTQIHNYDGIYDWHLTPATTNEGSANTLSPSDFHNGGGWNAGVEDPKHIYLDIQKAEPERGYYSVTVRAPHRNLTLMRDVTSGGKLIEQRQYKFSDFIHFDIQWRDTWGDEAIMTFAYAFEGRLYTTQLKISRPQGR